MDHMKEGDEPRFTTSALTAATSRETSRTFAPSPLPSQGGHTLKEFEGPGCLLDFQEEEPP